MKKIFSVILSLVFLLTLMANYAFADDTENQITNFAPKGVAYSSSEKNSLWTPVESVINGKYGGVDGEWQGWECAYPEVSVGQDTSNGFSGDYFGIDFKSRFYDIYEIKMNIGLHTLAGGQNATYTFEALIEGKWEQFVILKDDQAVPTDSEKYADYNAVMNDPNASTRVNATLYYTLEEPISTNNVRVTVSDYAKNYEGGDVLIFPFVYELEIFGKQGNTPDMILPEGAMFTTDVALHSYPSANQSSNGTYPFLAVDGRDDTYWECTNYEGGEYFTLMFDKNYEIGLIKMLLGTQSDNKIQATSLEYYLDGSWQVMSGATPTLKNAEAGFYGLDYEFESIVVGGIRVKFKRATDSLKLYSIEAHLYDAKTYAYENRFSIEQLASASHKNIAMIGKPYSSTSFAPYSNESYINDGLKNTLSKSWFTGTIDAPVYCGITFDYPHKINKVAVAVRDSRINGEEVMRFEIQALVNGEYVAITQGKSYDGDYQTEYTFDEIETTDVRIVINEARGAIPNVKELEIYTSEMLPMFAGIDLIDINDDAEHDNLLENHVCVKAPISSIIPIVISIGAAFIVAALVFLLIYKKKKEV